MWDYVNVDQIPGDFQENTSYLCTSSILACTVHVEVLDLHYTNVMILFDMEACLQALRVTASISVAISIYCADII